MIAGEARLSLDVRHESDEVRIRAVDTLIRAAQQISGRVDAAVRVVAAIANPAEGLSIIKS